jgi:hypothetical protein
VWARFNAGRDDQLWYYRSVVAAYRKAGFRGALLEELQELVERLEKAAGAGD